MNAGKGIAGHGTGAPAPTMQIPITRRVIFENATVAVAKAPNGTRVLQIIDPGSGTIYQLELPPDGAREIGRELSSAVSVAGAHEMPGSGG